MKAWQVSIVRNGMIAVTVALIYWLSLWPFQLEHQITQDPNYNANIQILYSHISSDSVFTPELSPEQAQERLESYLAKGKLAVISGTLSDMGRSTLRYISQSIIDMQLIRLKAGSLINQAGYIVAQENGPYPLNSNIVNGKVAALVEMQWVSNISDNDAIVLHPIQGKLENIPSRMRRSLHYYVHSDDETELAEIIAVVAAYNQKPYMSRPLYEHLAKNHYRLELYQMRLQRLAAVFLLLCLLLTIFSSLARVWHQEREIYRVERMLGRSSAYFFRQWFAYSLQQWLWGLGSVTLLFVILLLLRQHNLSAYLTLAAWAGSIAAVAIVMAALVSLASIRFPLARNSLDTEQNWRDYITPVFVTLALVFGITFLFAHALNQYIVSSQAVQQLGIHRLMARTTNAARDTLPPDLCNTVEVRSCVPFGLTSVNLWYAELFPLMEIQGFGDALRIQAEDAAALRIEVIEGRLPQAGKRELAINQRALETIYSYKPDFTLGDRLQIDYEVVGIYQTPPEAKHNIAFFSDIYEAKMIIPPHSPEFSEDFFLSPLGEHGFVLQIYKTQDTNAIKAAMRQDYHEIEFFQPSAYAKSFARAVGRSLLWLICIFTFAILLTVFAYHTLIATLISKRTLDISIWRLLGMNLQKLRLYLQQSILPIPIFTGIAGTILGCFFLILRRRHETLPYAFACGAILSLLLTIICIIIIQQKIRPLAEEEISETYRKAL